ncbi:MAG: hypothetical protein OQK76_11910 [Gammaproteobacteria bacterium]|nr:hypothetical protein [Gammaproteobacteria bacterium]
MNVVHGIHPMGQQSCLKSLPVILSFVRAKETEPKKTRTESQAIM